MYIHLPQPKQKCSKCGAIDQTELVTRDTWGKTQIFRRCIKCGHEKLISTTTYSPENTKGYVYTIPEPKDIEEF